MTQKNRKNSYFSRYSMFFFALVMQVPTKIKSAQLILQEKYVKLSA